MSVVCLCDEQLASKKMHRRLTRQAKTGDNLVSVLMTHQPTFFKN